jgi:glyceraldehyde 3-phosphate dehydrogenase
MPEDTVTIIQGINEEVIDPSRHHLISGASCTTTCLAFMVKTLLNHFGPDPILSASMVTVHATTGTQEILDQLPSAGTDDLRKNRSIFNNIILTTTGAAEALSLVIPEMRGIGFMAESVRIPINTGSIVILSLNIQEDDPAHAIDRDRINGIYSEAANGYFSQYLSYSESQNISSDIIGTASAAVIEGRETRTRTGGVKVGLGKACRFLIQGAPIADPASSIIEVPVTQVVVYGWYDNELGSFSNILGETTLRVAKTLL